MTRPSLLLLIASFAVGAGLTLVSTADQASATHDPAIFGYFPTFGWAAQAHSQGHNGYGSSNFPTWYGGTTSPAGYWYGGSPAGENSCAVNRYTNMNAAEAASESSTKFQPQLPDWPIGLYMTWVGCNVNVASRTLFTSFVNGTGGGSPGYTVHRPATSSQCSGQGLGYPCGDWATVSEVQKSWWDTRDDTTRRKFLMHEWGHSWSMGDYCGTHPGLSKNGFSPCLWPSAVAYYDIDDRALFLIYGQ